MPAHPNPPAVQRLDALEARVGALEAELRELRLLVGDICQALAEVALASVDDLGALNPTSPLHSSGHVQAKIARLFPATRAIVRDYLEHEDSYSGRLARTVRASRSPTRLPSTAAPMPRTGRASTASVCTAPQAM
jgi:hypothetical protein